MTQEEITVLAGHRIVSPWVMKLAMDVAKAEREACAKECDDYIKKWQRVGFLGDLTTAVDIGRAIRSRGEA